MLTLFADWRLFLPQPPGPAMPSLRDAIELFQFTTSAAVLILFAGAVARGVRASVERRARAMRRAQLTRVRQAWTAEELYRRVRSTLAVAQMVERRTFRAECAHPVARAALAARLQAVSGAHDLLLAGACTEVDLRQMVASLVSPLAPDERVTLRGGDVRLAPQRALTLLLTLHELAANAAESGALSTPQGQVGVHWDVLGRGETAILRLNWQESGGPTGPTRRGFGSHPIQRGLQRQGLGADVGLRAAQSGLTCTLAFPLGGLSAALPHNCAPSAAAAAS